MSAISLLFGIHCHQPVDNFSHVVDEATLKSYKPFLEVVSGYPNFKFSVHYSGWLLEYLQKNQKETFRLLCELSEKRIIEFFSGGYYEPILASIPSKDRIDQIKKLNKFIKKNFNQEPKGLWLTERVWDNSIIADVIECGIEYVAVDDYHFMSIGFKEEELRGYYVTEESGVSLKVFPISQELRYRIPFRYANEALLYIESIAKDNNAAIIFDDGEKFGLWPQTYEWVYQKEWLKLFLDALTSSKIVTPMHFSEYVKENKPLGLVYLPITSYYEMGEWSLFAHHAIKLEELQKLANENGFEKEAKILIKGGIWKNFLLKYKEASRIHKRALELSKKRDEIKDKSFDEELFKLQTNDVLWHGVFGGLYLPNLRDNAYRFLANAENIYYEDLEDELLEIADNNLDGYNEAKFVTNSFIAIFDQKDGELVELLLRDKRFNFQNTLTRYKEAYHYKVESQLDKESSNLKSSDGIDTIHELDTSKLNEYKSHLKFDWHTRNSFITHITDFSFNLDNFEYCNYKEYGDFVNKPFDLINIDSRTIRLVRNGVIYGEREYETKLSKLFSIKNNKIMFTFTLESSCHYDLKLLLEVNLHFANYKDVKFIGKNLKDRLYFEQIRNLSIKDSYTQKNIYFNFENNLNVYIFKVDTVSQSESGFDLTNQGVAIGFVVPFSRFLQIKGELILEDEKGK